MVSWSRTGVWSDGDRPNRPSLASGEDPWSPAGIDQTKMAGLGRGLCGIITLAWRLEQGPHSQVQILGRWWTTWGGAWAQCRRQWSSPVMVWTWEREMIRERERRKEKEGKKERLVRFFNRPDFVLFPWGGRRTECEKNWGEKNQEAPRRRRIEKEIRKKEGREIAGLRLVEKLKFETKGALAC